MCITKVMVMFWHIVSVNNKKASELWHWWLGDRKVIRPVKSWLLVCWWWRFDWSFACLVAAFVTTTSIIFSSDKIQNGDILVLAYWGSPGEMAVNTERWCHKRVWCLCRWHEFQLDCTAIGTGCRPAWYSCSRSRQQLTLFQNHSQRNSRCIWTLFITLMLLL